MKFRVLFSISQDEQVLKLCFWDWEIWRIGADNPDDSDIEEIKNTGKAGFLSFKKKDELDEEVPYDKLLVQALFYPNVEKRIWRACKKLVSLLVNFFSAKVETLEIKGSLGDPFYDSIALAMFNEFYFPHWEDDMGWSAKGEIILKTNIFRLFFFIMSILYELATLAFILWRGVLLAKENPNGENMDKVRRWIFLRCQNS